MALAFYPESDLHVPTINIIIFKRYKNTLVLQKCELKMYIFLHYYWILKSTSAHKHTLRKRCMYLTLISIEFLQNQLPTQIYYKVYRWNPSMEETATFRSIFCEQWKALFHHNLPWSHADSEGILLWQELHLQSMPNTWLSFQAYTLAAVAQGIKKKKKKEEIQ